jgi:hypothetical protein
MNAMFLESSKHSQSAIMHNIQSWRKSKRKKHNLEELICAHQPSKVGLIYKKKSKHLGP